jgi:outer membrane protein insertion porin family/translocation and assembly module TamA
MRQLLPRAALLALGLAAAPLDAQSRREEQIERPEVVDLNFAGVESVDEDELRESIATDESRCNSTLQLPLCWISKSKLWYTREYLDRTELARDLLRIRVFYWRRGYRETSVDTAVARRGDDKVAVTFRITEREPTLVERVEVVGPDSILPRSAVERLEALAGKPFNLLRLDSAIVGLRNGVWERGYADATLSDTTGLLAGRRAVDLVVAVEPGPKTTVDSIIIQGNEQIDDRTIRNSLAFEPGDVFRRSDVTVSQRNLYQSQLFRTAVVDLPGEQDSSKVVVVRVAESQLHAARVAGGISTFDFAQVEASWTDYNFLGAARKLTLRGGLANLLADQLEGNNPFLDVREQANTEDPRPYLRPNWQLGAEFTQPWFGSYRNSIGGSAFWRRRSAPGVYVDHGYGASATFTREVVLRLPVSLTYQFEVTELDRAGDVYFCIILGACDESTIRTMRRAQRLSPLVLSATSDHGNNAFNPTAGYRAQASLEHASAFTISDYRYNRASAEGSVYRAFGRAVLAVHLRTGWVSALSSTAEATGVGLPDDGTGPIVHPRKRFFAGGSRSVRGFGENQLGPRVLTIAPPSDTTALYATCLGARDTVACSALLAGRGTKDFIPRPVGGNSVLEGSVEFRFPIWGPLTGAAFVDGALVGNGDITEFADAAGAATPGLGIRYETPVGPVRVDVGYRPDLTQRLTVYTETENAEGRSQLVRIGERDFNANEGGRFIDRLVLHFSIGQAF